MNYEGNTLEISDAEITDQWHLGMLRDIGQKIAKNGVNGNLNKKDLIHSRVANRKTCPIVRVANIVSNLNSISYDPENPTLVLRGEATCACDQLMGVFLMVSLPLYKYFNDSALIPVDIF